MHEAIIGPGDVLFLPAFWWHYVESTGDVGDDDVTVSLPPAFFFLSSLECKISVRFSCFRAEQKGEGWPNKILTMRSLERCVAEWIGEAASISFFQHPNEGIPSLLSLGLHLLALS